MKHKICATILIIILSISGFSCKKKSANPIDDLPPLTITGANTFGCLVNGELFLPKVTSGPRAALEGSYGVEKGQTFLGITAVNNQAKGSRYILLYVSATNITQGQEYDLKISGQNSSSASYSYVGSDITEYKTNDKINGKVFIRYIADHIASGTFWFDAVSDTGEKIEIREGRFDIKFK